MKVPITLTPTGSVIPRDPKLVLRMQRAPAPAVAAPVAAVTPPPEPPPGVVIAAGADNFADATVIPLVEFRDVVAAYTYSKDFTVETGEPDTVSGATPHRTAWWMIFVPTGHTVWIELDLARSFASNGLPDTQLALYSLSESPDFANLSRIDESEDISADFWISRIPPTRLRGSTSGDPDGTRFYVQAGTWGDTQNIAYALRVSISVERPGVIPADGRDPDT